MSYKTHSGVLSMNLSLPLHTVLGTWMELYRKLAGEQGIDLKPDSFLFPALAPEGTARAGQRRRLLVAPDRQIGKPDTIARRALRQAGALAARHGLP